MDLLSRNVTRWLARLTANIALRLASRLAEDEPSLLETTADINPKHSSSNPLINLLITNPNTGVLPNRFTPGLELRIPYMDADYSAIQSIPPSGSVQALTEEGLEEYCGYEVIGNERSGVIHIRMNYLPNLSQQDSLGTSSIIMMGHAPAPEVSTPN